MQNNGAPLLCYFKLYASFRHHMWIQTGVTVRKRLRWVVTSVTLTFDLWPWPFAWTLRWSLVITPENFMMIRWWEHSQKGVTDRRTDGRTDRQTENTICRAAWSQLKIIGHLFYATSSFVHHFVAIGKFKLELQSGNAQSGSNRTIFLAVWPWNLPDDLEQGKSEGFESCDRPIVRKRPIWVKIGDVLYRVTLKFDEWPWKTIGHLSFAVSSFVQHFIAIGEFKLELQSGNAQFGSNSTIFRAVWPCNLMYDLKKQ